MRKIYVVYGEREADNTCTEPLCVTTTPEKAKAWAYENSRDSQVRLKIKEFSIGGEGTPRKKADALT